MTTYYITFEVQVQAADDETAIAKARGRIAAGDEPTAIETEGDDQ